MGEVIVNLQLHLGPQVLHSHHGPAPQPQVFRKISPSRLRRRARRAQARAMATAENASVSSLSKSDAAVQVCESTPARSEAAVQAIVTKTDEAVQVTAVSQMKNNAAVQVDVPLPPPRFVTPRQHSSVPAVQAEKPSHEDVFLHSRKLPPQQYAQVDQPCLRKNN